MNLKINRNKFYNALQIVSKSVSSYSPIPALSGILIQAKDGKVILTGSDSDISIQQILSNESDADLALSIIEEGSIVIDSRYLLEIVKKIDSDDINIEIIDGTLTRFFGGKAEFKINGYRPTDYPNIDFTSPETKFTLNARDLNTIINVTAFATSNKETRPVLTGVNFLSNGSSLKATATDSCRLAKKTFDIAIGEFNITVPAKSLNEVRSIFGNSDQDIESAVSSKKIQFLTENTKIQSKLLEGGYPETERLISKTFKYELVINRQALLHTIDRTSFIKTDNMSITRLQVNGPDDITLSSKSQEIGESKEDLTAVSYEGAPLDISFSGNYVIDACRALDSENIRIRFEGEMRPFILTNDSDDNSVLQLVLPVRTYN